MGSEEKATKRLQKEILGPLLDWYAKHARPLPWRKTRDPYAIWISEIMLQQTQVATVIPYWDRWMSSFPDIASLAAASEASVLKHWEGLGYYRRARSIIKVAAILNELDHQGRFPEDYDTIISLPGIGPYTAGAICSIALDKPTPILDGNVIRVLCRQNNLQANAGERQVVKLLWQIARNWVELADAMRPRPQRVCSHLNQAIMELGAMVCLPGKAARCEICPIAKACLANRCQSVAVADLPRLPKRPSAVKLGRVALILEHRGSVLLVEPSADGHNRGLWEFFTLPLAEARASSAVVEEAMSQMLRSRQATLASPAEAWKPIDHTITHHRIRLFSYRIRLKKALPAQPGEQWVATDRLVELAMPSAHQQLRQRLVGPTKQAKEKVKKT